MAGTPTTAPPQEDLSQDRLLDRLPRDAGGRPLLGGIPLVCRIGRGGMGSVYYGVHPRLGVEVAIKVLPFHLVEQDPKLVDRFFSEARIAAALSDNHLVRVLDVNHEHNTHFLVMEYVAGESAGGYLKRAKSSGGIPEREALEIVTAATRGLAVAHERGIVHRDIKPDNILIPRGELRKAKLSDLGLAKPEGGGQSVGTTSNIAMGTPGYMSPEQVEDAKTAGAASDVFSMGATLYALLSGHAPFAGSSLGVILRDTATKEPEPLPASVTPAVRALVQRCMAKDPARRLPNGIALLKALEGLPTGETAATIAKEPLEPTLMSAPKDPPRSGVKAGVAAVLALVAILAVVLAAFGVLTPKPSDPRSGPAKGALAIKALRTIATAEADFRANDRDNNRVCDFWTGDVRALHYLQPLLGNGEVDATPIGLLFEREIADADVTWPVKLNGRGAEWAGGAGVYHGYQFAALESFGEGADAVPYRTDTGGVDPALGANHCHARFGFAALPYQYPSFGRMTYIVNEDAVIWQKDLGGARVRHFPADPASEGWTKVE